MRRESFAWRFTSRKNCLELDVEPGRRRTAEVCGQKDKHGPRRRLDPDPMRRIREMVISPGEQGRDHLGRNRSRRGVPGDAGLHHAAWMVDLRLNMRSVRLDRGRGQPRGRCRRTPKAGKRHQRADEHQSCNPAMKTNGHCVYGNSRTCSREAGLVFFVGCNLKNVTTRPERIYRRAPQNVRARNDKRSGA